MAGLSVENQLSHLRPIILAMMRREGRNFKWCELGHHPLKGRLTLHHTKYEGATYYDLQIACYSCQMKAENKNLS
jgi:hypothetical protein